MKSQEPLALLIIIGLSIFVSAIHPYDGLTWLLEVSPVLIAAPVLAATYRRFTLTPLLYRLIFIHSLILITGGTTPMRAFPSVPGRRIFSIFRGTTMTGSAILRRD